MGRCMDCKYLSDRRWEDGSDDPDNYMSHSTYDRKYYCEKYGGYHFRGEYHNCFKTDESENDSSNSDESCYVTTACTRSQGLPDDCYELQTLRKFRDVYMVNLQDGKSEINEYYRLAPQIVKAINILDNSNYIYSQVYNFMILRCVDFIENKRFQDAYELYKDVTIKLYKRFVCPNEE